MDDFPDKHDDGESGTRIIDAVATACTTQSPVQGGARREKRHGRAAAGRVPAVCGAIHAGHAEP